MAYTMFSQKSLIIPDYVSPTDIPEIYNYFDYYNIAELDTVFYQDHLEQEYNVEDRPFYGRAIISVKAWYNNNGARSFYDSIVNNNCKMIYDEPDYWDLEFDEETTNQVIDETTNNENSETNYETNSETNYDTNFVDTILNDGDSVVSSDKEEEEDEDEDEDEEYYSEDDSVNNDGSEEEQDDEKDEDYAFEETDTESDYYYEYYQPVAKRVRHCMKTRSQKKRKYNPVSSNLIIDNTELKELLIKKNKNYLKNNKPKEYKNEWSRRLRQKLAY